jgi:hypothetical protein
MSNGPQQNNAAQNEAWKRLRGKMFSFQSVTPEPAAGPFPPEVTLHMAIFFTNQHGLSIKSTVNSGHVETVTLNDDATTISFSGGVWTEESLVGMPGDDANRSLVRRLKEVQELFESAFSRHAGLYDLTWQTCGSTGCDELLVLRRQSDSTTLTFLVKPILFD